MSSTGTDETIKISEELAALFKAKAEEMVPICYGSFKDDDEVCANWCPRAKGNYLDSKRDKIREKMNEPSGGLFYVQSLACCKSKMEELEEKINALQKELKDREKRRETRNMYLVPGGYTMGRIPVGNIRWVHDFEDFTKATGLILETKDTRLYAHPYGPAYDDAVGKIRKYDSQVARAYVKETNPSLPDQEFFSIKILTQQANPDGDLILSAEILDKAPTMSMKGKTIIIAVYGKSTQELVRIDDLGRL